MPNNFLWHVLVLWVHVHCVFHLWSGLAHRFGFAVEGPAENTVLDWWRYFLGLVSL